ncbi:MAG: hypothetical protein M1821_006682 [Bathelium mastoideum]|nr:MAG: hypothetical protein M1821_006682 [Bathelium mastoideum]
MFEPAGDVDAAGDAVAFPTVDVQEDVQEEYEVDSEISEVKNEISEVESSVSKVESPIPPVSGPRSEPPTESAIEPPTASPTYPAASPSRPKPPPRRIIWEAAAEGATPLVIVTGNAASTVDVDTTDDAVIFDIFDGITAETTDEAKPLAEDWMTEATDSNGPRSLRCTRGVGVTCANDNVRVCNTKTHRRGLIAYITKSKRQTTEPAVDYFVPTVTYFKKKAK